MKIDEIEIGRVYLTTVSGCKVRVKVLARVEPDGKWHKRTRFRVQRADSGKYLEKPRDAAALHPLVAVRRPPRKPVVDEAAYQAALADHLGWCPVCADFTVETCEPDATGQKCEGCAGVDGCGAEHALVSAMFEVRVRKPEPPRVPALEPRRKAENPRCALARGVVLHRFHGEYSAEVQIVFASAAEAAEARAGVAVAGVEWELCGMRSSPEDKRALACLVSSEALARIEEKFKLKGDLRIDPCAWGHCKDHCASQSIGGTPHSIDAGPRFTVEVYLPSLDTQETFNFAGVENELQAP